MVEPSSTATSRSPLIPIDLSGRARSSARRRSRGRTRAARCRSPRGTDGHQPLHVEAIGAQVGHQRGYSAGLAAALLLLARHVHLDQHRRPGGPLRDLRAQVAPVDALPERHVWGQLADLVALQATDGMPAHAGRSRVGLGHQLLGVVLPEVDQPSGHRQVHRRPVEALGDGQQGDRGGVAARRLDALVHCADATLELFEGDGAGDHGAIQATAAEPDGPSSARARWLNQRSASQAVQSTGSSPTAPPRRRPTAATPARRSRAVALGGLRPAPTGRTARPVGPARARRTRSTRPDAGARGGR